MKRNDAIIAWILSTAACAAPHHNQESPGTHAGHHGDVDRRAMDHHFAKPEEFAKEWNDPARDAWQKPEEIVEALELDPGATVADLGAGTGYLIESLRRAVGEEGQVLALDVEPAMIEFLKERSAAAGWTNVRAVESAHDDPKLAAGSVNGVVTLNTWHHVDARQAFAAKLYDGLAEGGRFVVVDFLPESTEGRGPPPEMRLAAESVVRELESAGFQAEIVEETLPRHYIVVGTKPRGA